MEEWNRRQRRNQVAVRLERSQADGKNECGSPIHRPVPAHGKRFAPRARCWNCPRRCSSSFARFYATASIDRANRFLLRGIPARSQARPNWRRTTPAPTPLWSRRIRSAMASEVVASASHVAMEPWRGCRTTTSVPSAMRCIRALIRTNANAHPLKGASACAPNASRNRSSKSSAVRKTALRRLSGHGRRAPSASSE